MMRNGSLWPWGLAAVLAVTVGGNIWVMRLAAGDPTFAIEPDYYRKAVTWDSVVAQSARNSALGWRLTPRFDPPDRDGLSALTVELQDADGGPLAGAHVRVAATHNARGSDVVHADLTETARGRYSAPLRASRPGVWELRFEVEHLHDRFTATSRADNSWTVAPR